MLVLRKVFQRFRDHNLKLKPKKRQFFKKKVEFLGKLVSGKAIAIAPDKLEAVKRWPPPINKKELLSYGSWTAISPIFTILLMSPLTYTSWRMQNICMVEPSSVQFPNAQRSVCIFTSSSSPSPGLYFLY